MIPLLINGIEVCIQSGHDLQQSYAPVEGGIYRQRTLNGRLSITQGWSKLKTSLSAAGWTPALISTLNRYDTYELACCMPRVIDQVSHQVILPAARRGDVAPRGYALVDGQLQPSAVSLVGNMATVQLVPNATLYRVMYWPLLLVSFSTLNESLDASGAVYAWQIEAEEV